VSKLSKLVSKSVSKGGVKIGYQNCVMGIHVRGRELDVTCVAVLIQNCCLGFSFLMLMDFALVTASQPPALALDKLLHLLKHFVRQKRRE